MGFNMRHMSLVCDGPAADIGRCGITQRYRISIANAHEMHMNAQDSQHQRPRLIGTVRKPIYDCEMRLNTS